MTTKIKSQKGLTAEAFQRKLEQLVDGRPIKIWLAKSALGRIEVIFSVGDAQGCPIKNFDHIGGFYLMGENVPTEYIDRIHGWFLEFTRINFTPHRLDRHFIDVRYRSYYDQAHKQHDELLMHVPLTVHTPTTM
jgi:hypothetical protein